MTRDEFKEKVSAIYRNSPGQDSLESLDKLFKEMNKTHSAFDVALMAAQALDATFPNASAKMGSAAERVVRNYGHLDDGSIH